MSFRVICQSDLWLWRMNFTGSVFFVCQIIWVGIRVWVADGTHLRCYPSTASRRFLPFTSHGRLRRPRPISWCLLWKSMSLSVLCFSPFWKLECSERIWFVNWWALRIRKKNPAGSRRWLAGFYWWQIFLRAAIDRDDQLCYIIIYKVSQIY